MEAVLNQKDDLYIAGKKKWKNLEPWCALPLLQKAEMLKKWLFFYVCTVGCALLCTYTAEDIKYKDWREGRRWLSDGEGMWPTLLSRSACVDFCQAQWTLTWHMRGKYIQCINRLLFAKSFERVCMQVIFLVLSRRLLAGYRTNFAQACVTACSSILTSQSVSIFPIHSSGNTIVPSTYGSLYSFTFEWSGSCKCKF